MSKYQLPKQFNQANVSKFIEREKEEYRTNANININQLTWFLKRYFITKEIFGLGRDRIFDYIKKNYPSIKLTRRMVNRILQSFELTQLFNPTKKTKDIAKTISTGPMSRVEMDLLDMTNQEINGYKWIMSATDTFSKYGWAIPLKDKQEKTVLKGMKDLLKLMVKTTDRKPLSILSDNGSEFINKSFKDLLREEGIKQIFTKAGNSSHAKQVERFNLYLRKSITKYKTQFDDLEWNKYLTLILKNYNKTISRITKKSPEEIIRDASSSTKNKQVKENIKKAILPKNNNNGIIPYKQGDNVRLKLEAEGFEKPSNSASWSRQIYTIIKVYKPKKNSVLQPSYMLETENKNKIDEKFYHNDLQLINTELLNNVKTPEKYNIQKVIGEKTVKNSLGKNVRMLLIKWKGYSINEATWEPYEVIKSDAPGVVKKWDEFL